MAAFVLAAGNLGATLVVPRERTLIGHTSSRATLPVAESLGPCTGWNQSGGLTPFSSTWRGPVFLAAAALMAMRRSERQTRKGAMARRAARLHGTQSSRSPLVNWYCNEQGIPLEMREPRPSPHPFGQVPHLSDDGGVEVFESGAILLYLADKYGGQDSPEKRARYTKWIIWANSTLEDICFGPGFSGTQLGQPSRAMDTLEKLLGESDWLLGDEFSVADVAVASYLNYAPVFFGNIDLRQRPKTASYMKRCAARPAFVQSFGEQHAAAVRDKVMG